nr:MULTISPECIES: AMP-binding protein [Nocardia]
MATLGGQLSINARRHPHRSALVFGDTERTYRELDAEINQYAHALLSLDVRKGDRVAVLSPNSDCFILALYGAFKIGAIAVPLNPRATARDAIPARRLRRVCAAVRRRHGRGGPGASTAQVGADRQNLRFGRSARI